MKKRTKKKRSCVPLPNEKERERKRYRRTKTGFGKGRTSEAERFLNGRTVSLLRQRYKTAVRKSVEEEEEEEARKKETANPRRRLGPGEGVGADEGENRTSSEKTGDIIALIDQPR